MPADNTYIEDSLELNLFFLRIMKEHALFLQLGFTPKNKDMGAQAESFRTRFDDLLRYTIQAARGYVSPAVMASGELFTNHTADAEKQTQFFTGATIDSQLTVEEYSVGGNVPPPMSMQPTAEVGGNVPPPMSMQPTAEWINGSALNLTRELLAFKERVRNEVISCNIFTGNYPLTLDHDIAEAGNYISMLKRLSARQLEMGPMELADEEALWNNLMREHAEFTDGLLDPTETAMKQTAAKYAVQFAALIKQSSYVARQIQMLPALTRRTLPAVENIRNFTEQVTEQILSCKLKSGILPLLSDHQLRETNYYLRILRETIS